MRRNKIKLVISILVAVSIVLIACIAIIWVGRKTLKEKDAQISDLQYEIDKNKQVVYVAIHDIIAGEEITESKNVMKQEIYTGLSEDYYLPEDKLGGIAVIDIKEQQPIMADMVTSLEITQDTREYELSVANLMTDQKEKDYVDIRIMYPTGEDYTILSKKPMFNLNLKECVFYSYLNEDEILRMASATMDAYTITGAYIYTARYVEPSLQEVSTPNYLVKPEVIDLINTDPNVLDIAKDSLNLEARINLEKRLRGLSEDTLNAIANGHKVYDTAGKGVRLDMEYKAEDTENSNSSEGFFDGDEDLEPGGSTGTENADEGAGENTDLTEETPEQEEVTEEAEFAGADEGATR